MQQSGVIVVLTTFLHFFVLHSGACPKRDRIVGDYLLTAEGEWIHVDDLPDFSEADIKEILSVVAALYERICNDHMLAEKARLDAMGDLWQMADDFPELQPVFRRVHDEIATREKQLLN